MCYEFINTPIFTTGSFPREDSYKKVVYLTGSICGGRVDAELYRRIE